MTEDGRLIHKDSLATATDHELYAAWLVTSPEFGCIQFEAKCS